MVLTEQARTYSSVVNSNKSVVFIGLLSVLAVIHIAQIVLFSLKENDCQSVKSQSTSDVVV